MHAIHIRGDDLVWDEADTPQCGVGQVRIRVAATAINRADLVQRAGGYPPPPGASDILGLECAGEVIEVGDGVQSCAPGDRVCALLAGGGYAQQAVVPAAQVLPVPDGLSMAQAASLPEVFATAYLNLYMEARVQLGETVLVHAGASGVGTAAVQMLKHTGNPCFVTAGSSEKIAQCVTLGAAAGHNRHEGSFLGAVQAWCAEGVDVILDPVGAAYLADNLACLSVDGRLLLIGLMGGVDAGLNLGAFLMRRHRLIGSTLRTRSVAQKGLIMEGLRKDIWPALAAGTIIPVIDSEFDIQQADAAHARVASNETFGKVILRVPD